MEACFAYCKGFLLLFIQESMHDVSTLSVRIKRGKSYCKISRISKETNIVLAFVFVFCLLFFKVHFFLVVEDLERFCLKILF